MKYFIKNIFSDILYSYGMHNPNKRQMAVDECVKSALKYKKDVLDQLYKEVEALPFSRMDIGKNWDAGEWISRKDVLTLIKKLNK